MQVVLERADVLLPDAEVVQEVARALAESQLDCCDFVGMLRFEREGTLPQVTGRGQRAFEKAVHGPETDAEQPNESVEVV